MLNTYGDKNLMELAAFGALAGRRSRCHQSHPACGSPPPCKAWVKIYESKFGMRVHDGNLYLWMHDAGRALDQSAACLRERKDGYLL